MLWVNFKPKRAAAASRGFLATARFCNASFTVEISGELQKKLE